jgi:flagellar biosynthesis component FlhA
VLRDARLHRAVLVTGSSVRRSLYELLSFEFPGLVVLAREEIAPGSELDILETIEPFEPAGRAGAEIRSG